MKFCARKKNTTETRRRRRRRSAALFESSRCVSVRPRAVGGRFHWGNEFETALALNEEKNKQKHIPQPSDGGLITCSAALKQH